MRDSAPIDHGSGNTDVCWMEVMVEDKVKPQCEAPHNETIACSDLPYDFDPEDPAVLQSLFGTPTGIDNCPVIGRALSSGCQHC